MDDKSVSLGGNIQLSGFSGLDSAEQVVLKKIIGNYSRRYSEICDSFELLKLQMKTIHEKEKSEKYEIHGTVLDKGKHFNATFADYNLFFALDKVLKKLESEIGHARHST